VLQASNSKVYCDPIVHPQTEIFWGNVNLIGLRSYYDHGMLRIATLIRHYYLKSDLIIKIIWISSSYWSYMNPNDVLVVSNLIEEALKGFVITI
jgi:UDP-glucuronate decarboxylase